MGTTVSSIVLEKEELALSDFTRLHSLWQPAPPDALLIKTVSHLTLRSGAYMLWC